jgi:hypothetical protein
MARVPFLIAGLGALSGLLTFQATARAQQSLGPIRASGQSVTPAFEGWYRNPDGTYSISFGYFNRNAKESVDIAIGPDNNISAGGANQGQPAHFDPRRHWGVFTVTVPADFGKQKVTWTLKNRGQSYAISGSLDPLWEIDALEGEAGSGNTPPVLKFSDDGPEGRGPGGVRATAPTTRVGAPLTLSVSARDDGKAPPSIVSGGRGETPVTLTWFKHQGPGDVTFAPATGRVPNAGGKATTTATFSAPGDYIVRVRANDASGVAGAGHAQCCWTNGFIKVTVTP